MKKVNGVASNERHQYGGISSIFSFLLNGTTFSFLFVLGAHHFDQIDPSQTLFHGCLYNFLGYSMSSRRRTALFLMWPSANSDEARR